MTVVQVENLEIRAGYKTLIRDFSFTMEYAEAVAVIGANGLGKTTLLRTLCGVSRPYKGNVKVAGVPIWPTAAGTVERQSVCYLASQPALFLDHPVSANLEFYVRAHGAVWSAEEAHTVLKAVGLEGRFKQSARTLSTGQKRRLTLAFLLMCKPRILFLDEPTNGLDTDGVKLFLDSLGGLLRENRSAILLATHDPQLIGWCGRSIELRRWAS